MNAYLVTLYPSQAPDIPKYRMTMAAYTAPGAEKAAKAQLAWCSDREDVFRVECTPLMKTDLEETTS